MGSQKESKGLWTPKFGPKMEKLWNFKVLMASPNYRIRKINSKIDLVTPTTTATSTPLRYDDK